MYTLCTYMRLLMIHVHANHVVLLLPRGLLHPGLPMSASR